MFSPNSPCTYAVANLEFVISLWLHDMSRWWQVFILYLCSLNAWTESPCGTGLHLLTGVFQQGPKQADSFELVNDSVREQNKKQKLESDASISNQIFNTIFNFISLLHMCSFHCEGTHTGEADNKYQNQDGCMAFEHNKQSENI